MEQPQLHVVLQLGSILDEPPKDVKMSLVLFAPPLQGGHIIEIPEAKSLISGVGRFIDVDDFHEPVTEASDGRSLVREELHTLDEDRMHRLEIQLSLMRVRVRPILTGADHSQIIPARDTDSLGLRIRQFLSL